MRIKAVLFDLDGTLLPMDQDIFVKAYFSGLAKKLVPHGYNAEALISAVWAGTKAMIQNDGSRTNEDAFWARFCEILGPQARSTEPILQNFYENEFQSVQNVCGFAPEASQIVGKLKSAGYRVILATNPIFPAIATQSRIRWAGLEPQDFESYTTYENSSRCKPNPDYYRDILTAAELTPDECLMVGNDVGDDMIARELGCHVFLLTDCLINAKCEDINKYPHGGFHELSKYLEEIA